MGDVGDVGDEGTAIDVMYVVNVVNVVDEGGRVVGCYAGIRLEHVITSCGG
ncbi:MAG: hypothetical protein ABWZ78_10755 [Burkholderiaceae bacterium]